jgi:hypothetical protein
MRIVENSPSRLRLRDRTRWVSAACLGSTLILAGGAIFTKQPDLFYTAALFLVFAVLALHATDVTFDKTRRICDLRRLNMLRLTRMHIAFEDILDVRIDLTPVDDARTLLCRLSVVTPSGRVPLSAAFEPDEARYEAMRDAVLDTVIAAGPRPPAVDPVRRLVEDGHITDAVAVLRQREGLTLSTALTRVNALRDQLGS